MSRPRYLANETLTGDMGSVMGVDFYTVTVTDVIGRSLSLTVNSKFSNQWKVTRSGQRGIIATSQTFVGGIAAANRLARRWQLLGRKTSKVSKVSKA